ncbi:hypothetical protein J4207_02225 [Candidatus Woesearchaeota archaeon]|nr:hypothetical protein [Candidatus Woesearchaeota archaeon]
MVRIDIRVNPVEQPSNTITLTPDMILKYLLGTDEKIETTILCKPEKTELVTTDLALYEAMGSIKPYDNVQLNKLTKLLESVHIFSHKQQTGSEKPILKEERVEQLRKIALDKQSNKKSKLED